MDQVVTMKVTRLLNTIKSHYVASEMLADDAWSLPPSTGDYKDVQKQYNWRLLNFCCF